MVIRAKVDQLEGENQELNNKNRVLEDKLTAQG
jgi:outer membrane murein-binding lipoprotein Lpp